MLCVVMKEFMGNGEEFVRNQLVDAVQFRNVSNLMTARYLRPATPDEIESAQEVEEPPARRAPVASMRIRRRRAA